MISTWTSNDSFYENIFSKYGFLNHKDIPVICYANEFGEQVLSNGKSSHFTFADTDNI